MSSTSEPSSTCCHPPHAPVPFARRSAASLLAQLPGLPRPGRRDGARTKQVDPELGGLGWKGTKWDGELCFIHNVLSEAYGKN